MATLSPYCVKAQLGFSILSPINSWITPWILKEKHERATPLLPEMHTMHVNELAHDDVERCSYIKGESFSQYLCNSKV
jgi:hypothetical protein